MHIDIKMKEKCSCWLLYTSLGFAITSGLSYTQYLPAYKDYKNLKNPDRENDYEKSKIWLRAGTVSGGLALGTLAVWALCHAKKSKEIRKDEEKTRRIGFVPLFQSGASQNIQIGIAYQF